MARQSQAWKDLERDVTKALKALGAKRVYRGDDFSVKDVDVKCSRAKWLKIDAKYRAKHSHHRFMQEILDKYCTKPHHVPLLVTKHKRQKGAFATVSLDFFAKLLIVYVAHKEAGYPVNGGS